MTAALGAALPRRQLQPDEERDPAKRVSIARSAQNFARESAVAVDDPPALEIVRGQLDLDPVAREDADPVPPHLACGVAEGLVAVVERNPVHAVPERLHDLALQLDLVFLLCHSLTSDVRAPARRRGHTIRVVATRQARRSSPRGPSRPRGLRTPPWRPRSAT